MSLKYQSLIDKMTLGEKASLMSGDDFWHSRAIKRLELPAMAMADGPHGLRKQADAGDHLGLVEGVPATCFPTSATMANSWDKELCEAVGKALGAEAYYHDVNVILGPGLNIKRSPLCGRNFEYFSEDPYLSGKLASAYVKGIQSNGISACLKHFAANNQEYLRMTNDSVVDERTLRELYLTGFEIAVKESRPKAVMSSYNKINGTYAHENKFLLRDILVDEWGFDGMVVSDWGGSNDPVEAIKAGAHLEMPSPGNDSVHQIVDAVKSGILDESILNQRVDEYLKVVYATKITQKYKVDYDHHHQLAKEAAESAIVLLKNEGQVLPLNNHDRVAIIGDFADIPRYQGAGSSMVNPSQLDSVKTFAEKSTINMVAYAKGYDRNGQMDNQKLQEAIQVSKEADITILFVGLNEISEMEGHDRNHLKIPENQIKLINEVSKVAKKTIAVMSAGSVTEMKWEKHCDGIVHGYLTGQAGGESIINVLTGQVNPSGKLSETYPFFYESCPNVRYYPGKEKTSEYRESLYVGYRYYEKMSEKVRYPFGYGLSYTSFNYSHIKVDDHQVSCQVTNTGSKAGSEITQLYIGKNQKNIHRPIKELKGFSKNFLEPGESVEVVIPFNEYAFRYYDVHNKQFEVEKGSYSIYIGSSSQDIRLHESIEIQGITPKKEDKESLQAYFTGQVADVSLETFEVLNRKKVAQSNWDRDELLTINDSMSQMRYAKSFLARITIKILISLRERSVKKGKPDLNLFFLTNMPLRAIAKMSDGAFSIAMVEQVLLIINGSFFKGIVGLIKTFRKYRKRGSIHVEEN